MKNNFQLSLFCIFLILFSFVSSKTEEKSNIMNNKEKLSGAKNKITDSKLTPRLVSRLDDLLDETEIPLMKKHKKSINKKVKEIVEQKNNKKSKIKKNKSSNKIKKEKEAEKINELRKADPATPSKPAEAEAKGKDKVNTNKDILAEGWLSITSVTLANPDYFPFINTPSGIQKVFYDSNFTRLNPEYSVNNKDVPYPTAFYFKLNKDYLFYFTSKKSDKILSTISLLSIKQASLQIKNPSCLDIYDFKENKFEFCSEEIEVALSFVCKIQKEKGFELERTCNKSGSATLLPNILVREIEQPLIIIPLPSKYCNTNWNYNKQGANWECECINGKEQSPVNLPSKEKAVENSFKPNFEYLLVDKVINTNDAQINVLKGDKLKVIFENSAIKIKHPNMGRIVTPDGQIFQAKEIIFHNPSEHLINDKRMDLEMQVVHYGITKGDISKKLVLSILFTSSPGSLNKFFDKINVYDLPNPLDKYREIEDNLFIPYVFFSSEESDMNIMKPFSFFTYQGSMTAPPCEESVIHYVTSDPIPLSNTSITLMKEALRVPDMMDVSGNLQIDNNVYENFREVQPLNGRAVFHYDHIKFDCPEVSNTLINSSKDKENGHYEKVVKNNVKYFFVPGYEPSGLPNSILVTDSEANGNS